MIRYESSFYSDDMYVNNKVLTRIYKTGQKVLDLNGTECTEDGLNVSHRYFFNLTRPGSMLDQNNKEDTMGISHVDAYEGKLMYDMILNAKGERARGFWGVHLGARECGIWTCECMRIVRDMHNVRDI